MHGAYGTTRFSFYATSGWPPYALTSRIWCICCGVAINGVIYEACILESLVKFYGVKLILLAGGVSEDCIKLRMVRAQKLW